MRPTILVLAVAAAIPLALAQTGTPNLPSAYIWDGAKKAVWDADARCWEDSSNVTWYIGLRGRVTERTEATLGIYSMDDMGADPIGGQNNSISAIRISRYRALNAQFKVRLNEDDDPAVSLIFGADFPLHKPRGTNRLTGGTAYSRGPIFTLAIPVQWGDDHSRTTWMLVPKMACFDSLAVVWGDGLIKNFGTVIAIGAGVIHRLSTHWAIFADITAILDGDNTIDVPTNTVEDEPVWAAGVRWKAGRTTNVEAFATNAAGPTGATSLIGAPDNSVGFGLRLTSEF